MSGSGIDRRGAYGVLGVLGVLVAVDVPSLGSDAWPFRTPAVAAHGLLGPLVRAAHGRFDLGVVRTPAVLAGVLVAAVAAAGWRAQSWRRGVLAAVCVVVVCLLTVPATLLQVGLRQGSAPWFHTNDSTYQIELAGVLVRHGHTPYGHDYAGSGLERFYSLDGTVKPGVADQQVALKHLAYFPGTPLLGAAWGALPSPWSDFRLLVALATIGMLGAALLFPGPQWGRLALGTLAAANPLAVQNAWFGTADEPTLLLLFVAFALTLRRRPGWAGVAVGAAILTKQFALVAVPFLAVMLLLESRSALRRAALAALGVIAVGALPFLVADPRALWEDTVTYGTGTYRILGYGLSALLLRAHLIADRNSHYPFFLLALVVWLPVTALLARAQWQARAAWLGGAGFTASIFLLLFIGRAFHASYLVYPLTGIVLAGLLALAERGRAGA